METPMPRLAAMLKRAMLCLLITFATLQMACAQSGEIVFYAFTGDHIAPTIRAFNKRYPNIKVRAITLQGPAMIARLRAEKDNPRCDVVDSAADLLLTNTDLLAPYTSKEASQFPSWAVIRKGDDVYGYGFSVAVQIFLINTSRMPLADAPRSWKDLLKPQYRSKFLLGNPGSTTAGYDSYAQMLQIAGPAEIETFINNAVFSPETNLVPQEVGRGEVPMGLVEETKAFDIKEQGYPVELIYPSEGLVPTVDGWALVRNGPNPENARLFVDFMNSLEGQNLNVAYRNRRVGREGADSPKGLPPMSQVKINDAVDVSRMTTERQANIALFNKFFVKKTQGQ
jgi:iron(III) transport system substrate-binding protein